MNMFFFIILIFFSLITGCSIGKNTYIENDNYSKYFNYYIDSKMYINSKKYTLLYYFNSNFDLKFAKERIEIIKNNDLNKMDIYVIVLYSIENSNKVKLIKLFNNLDVFYRLIKNKKSYKNEMHIMGFAKNNMKQPYNIFIYTAQPHISKRRNNE